MSAVVVRDSREVPVNTPNIPGFSAGALYGSVIAVPLLQRMDAQPPDTVHRVVIDLNLGYPDGRDAAGAAVRELIGRIIEKGHAGERVDDRDAGIAQYVVARLTAEAVRELVRRDRAAKHPAIYRIWPDFEVGPLINRSAATVKADAARTAFAATGAGIVWAVVDSGIDGAHPHFAMHDTLDVTDPVSHQDFTGKSSPLADEFGHGTHVAGIIAGELAGADSQPLHAYRATIDQDGDVEYLAEPVTVMAGMAPSATLVSYKVLDEYGAGDTTAILAALQHVQQVNNFGRDIKIHGINLSVGYPFDPQWFACGHSPICVEVGRLVKSGVVVVVAAGNTGFGYNQDLVKGNVSAGLDLTINDPGNAELAITVGSTHRDMPHQYGVSYFSSKGPTGDGRAKPDLVAPGERILSCAAGQIRTTVESKPGVTGRVEYVEDSGTSMSAAHVSGVIAAFLSIRREYIEQPTEIKRIFTTAATDLGRVPYFQGHGLIDLMRAIQLV